MSRKFYESLDKSVFLKGPEKYPWNCVLAYVQFTQEELLCVRAYVDLAAMIKHQRCLTRAFLRAHFAEDIAEDHDVSWEQIEYLVPE